MGAATAGSSGFTTIQLATIVATNRGSVARACACIRRVIGNVDEAALLFAPLPGLESTRAWGVIEGAGYRIEVPAQWNGELVVWAWGFTGFCLEPGDACRLIAREPWIRRHLLERGYAWANTSLSTSGWAVSPGRARLNLPRPRTWLRKHVAERWFSASAPTIREEIFRTIRFHRLDAHLDGINSLARAGR